MTNDIKTLVKNGPAFFGVLFDGTNAKEIALKLREIVADNDLRVGVFYSKSWIKLESDIDDTKVIIKKDTWVLWNEIGIKTVAKEVFEAEFKRSNPRAKKSPARYVKHLGEGYNAIQFTGKNSTDVAQFAREHGVHSRAGGSYVRFQPAGEEKVNIQKGEWLGFPIDGSGWFIGSQAEVASRFRIG
jgi:hypothetical protein